MSYVRDYVTGLSQSLVISEDKRMGSIEVPSIYVIGK